MIAVYTIMDSIALQGLVPFSEQGLEIVGARIGSFEESKAQAEGKSWDEIMRIRSTLDDSVFSVTKYSPVFAYIPEKHPMRQAKRRRIVESERLYGNFGVVFTDFRNVSDLDVPKIRCVGISMSTIDSTHLAKTVFTRSLVDVCIGGCISVQFNTDEIGSTSFCGVDVEWVFNNTNNKISLQIHERGTDTRSIIGTLLERGYGYNKLIYVRLALFNSDVRRYSLIPTGVSREVWREDIPSFLVDKIYKFILDEIMQMFQSDFNSARRASSKKKTQDALNDFLPIYNTLMNTRLVLFRRHFLFGVLNDDAGLLDRYLNNDLRSIRWKVGDNDDQDVTQIQDFFGVDITIARLWYRLRYNPYDYAQKTDRINMFIMFGIYLNNRSWEKLAEEEVVGGNDNSGGLAF